MPSAATQDFHFDTGLGRIFARRWTPPGQPLPAPIVLFHDSLGCVDLWRDFPERLCLATGRSVIAYDRLGFGRSDPHPGVLRPDFIGAEAHGGFARLRAGLALDRFIAFGHSVGGGMAAACAAAYGEDCVALVTESAQAFVEDRTLEGLRQARRSFARPGELDRLKKYHGEKAAWVLSAWLDTWLAPGFARWTMDDDLDRLHCPVLALHGDGDEYGSPRHPERIAGRTGGCLAILRGCGHVPHREQADVVIGVLQRWLADPRARCDDDPLLRRCDGGGNRSDSL